jgi:tetratricopeptide (TPR) repeat protein
MSTLAGKTSPGKPRNPYIAGKALGSDQGFFGRQDVFEMVESTLAGNQTNAIVLFGQRRIGKTSVLLQLARRLAPLGYLPIYLDLMDRANRPVGEVLHALASAIAIELDWPAPEAGRFDGDGVYFQQEVLPRLYKGLSEHQRPVFLLDEFDVLDTAEEQRLGSNAAANNFFPHIRRLIEQEQRVGFIFVVGRKTADLSIHAKAVFKAARYKRVSILDRKSAIDLVRTAEALETLSFAEAAVDRVLDLTSGHPYFTQLLCGLLWDRAWRGHTGSSPPRVDTEAVESAVPMLLEAGENVFEWIWEGLPAAERVIFSAIAQVVDERSAIGDEDLTEMLQGQGIRILTRELELAPATLVEWEMLAKHESGYGFFIEVLRRWVVLRKPLLRVKVELDRVVPLADTLYQTGSAYYRQGDLDLALDQLRQALRVNPNHLKARLLVAEISTAIGDLATARKELDEAYRYDKDAARYPLIKVLLLQGEELEQDRREDEALVLYEQVLALSPRERVARERLDALWRQRGDRALEANDLDSAYKAYQHARLDEQQLKEVGDELKLQNSYSEALGLVEQKNWAQAILVLSKIIYLRPAYKHAAQYLAKAVEAQQAAEQFVVRQVKPRKPEVESRPRHVARDSHFKKKIALFAVLCAVLSATLYFQLEFVKFLYVTFMEIVVLVVVSYWIWPPTKVEETYEDSLGIGGDSGVYKSDSFGKVFFLGNEGRVGFLQNKILKIVESRDSPYIEIRPAGFSGFDELVVTEDRQVVLLGSDHKVYFLNVDGAVRRILPPIPCQSDAAPKHLAVSGDGRKVAVSVDDQIWLWEVHGVWWKLPQFECGPRSLVRTIALNSTGSIVAISLDKAESSPEDSEDAIRVVLRGSTDGQMFGERPMRWGVYQIAFSPDRLLWATASITNGQIFSVPRASDPQRIFSPMITLSCDADRSIAFSPDSKFLAVGNILAGAHVADVLTGQHVATLISTGHVGAVDFSPNGMLVAANVTNVGIVIFDLEKIRKEKAAL